MVAEDFVSRDVRYGRFLNQSVEEIKELEATVEGLSDQNTELERALYDKTRRCESLESKFDSAIGQLEHVRRVLRSMTEAAERASRSVRALRDVPLSDLDDAVNRAGDEVDSIVLS